MKDKALTPEEIVETMESRLKAADLTMELTVRILSTTGAPITTFSVNGGIDCLTKVEGWLEGWICARSFNSLGVSISSEPKEVDKLPKKPPVLRPPMTKSGRKKYPRNKKLQMYFYIHPENWQMFDALRKKWYGDLNNKTGMKHGSSKGVISYLTQWIRENPESQKCFLNAPKTSRFNHPTLKHRKLILENMKDIQFFKELEDKDGALTHAIRTVYDEEFPKKPLDTGAKET